MFPVQFIALLLLLAGCASGPAAAMGTSGESEPQKQGELIEFAGTVVHVSLEGGFYGIVADQGKKYDPIDLPESFQTDGMEVRVKARTLPGTVGFHMWGTKIEVLEIRRQ